MTYGIKNFHKVRDGLVKDAKGAGIDFGNRLSGRTTARALQILSDALNNPGNKYELIDHLGTEAANAELAYKTQTVIDQLGLEGFSFEDGTVTFKLVSNVPSA